MYFERLKDMRESHKMTQEEIGKLLECQRAVYQRYESGIREIPVWAVIKLAEYYNCTVDYLLGLSIEKGAFGAENREKVKRMKAYGKKLDGNDFI